MRQVPGFSYNWWGFQGWDTLQDSTDNSNIDKVEISLWWQEYFSQFQDTTDTLPCHIRLPACLWIMDPHSRAPKKNTSHGNEVLPQDTTHLIQRPCYQRGSPCQNPAGNRTTWRSPAHRKETQTAVVRSCLPFIRSGQNHLARHSERRKKTRQTAEEVRKQYQETVTPGWVRSTFIVPVVRVVTLCRKGKWSQPLLLSVPHAATQPHRWWRFWQCLTNPISDCACLTQRLHVPYVYYV